MIRRLLLAAAAALVALPATAQFEFRESANTTGTLELVDGTSTVLAFNYGDKLAPGVDPKYTRACYIHPLYSLDGEPLTDDFPADHRHHRGVYWAWPHVETRGIKSETWHPAEIPMRQHFVRWTKRKVEDGVAVLAMENQWLLRNEEPVAKENVTLRVHPVKDATRAIDLELTLEAVGGPLIIRGTKEENKGYGGLCFRAAPRFKEASIATDAGEAKKDLVKHKAKWARLTTNTESLTIAADPSHPDYPPLWMVRNSYTGFINASWPGLETVELLPGKPITLRYQLVVENMNKTGVMTRLKP